MSKKRETSLLERLYISEAVGSADLEKERYSSLAGKAHYALSRRRVYEQGDLHAFKDFEHGSFKDHAFAAKHHASVGNFARAAVHHERAALKAPTEELTTHHENMAKVSRVKHAKIEGKRDRI